MTLWDMRARLENHVVMEEAPGGNAALVECPSTLRSSFLFWLKTNRASYVELERDPARAMVAASFILAVDAPAQTVALGIGQWLETAGLKAFRDVGNGFYWWNLGPTAAAC